MPEDPHSGYAAGEAHPADLLIGYTSMEGVNRAPNPVTAEAFKARLEREYQPFGAEFLAMYPAGSDEEATRSNQRLEGESAFKWQAATWARQQKVEIGGVIILTDSETWTGSIHPFQALTAYRKALVKDLRQVVVGMEARPFTIADPTDKLSMDVVGFDASAPNVISSFIAGDLG